LLSIYELKPRFQNLLRPFVGGLAQVGISANQVTVFSCIISIAVGGLLFVFNQNRLLFFILPLWMFVRMALNAIDGMLAREHNMKSSLGAILNELTDVISDTALYLPFVLLYEPATFLIILVIVFSILTEMTGVVAVQIGASRRYDGPMGKSDRAFLFGVLALLWALNVPFGNWYFYIFTIVLFLLLLTIFNRAKMALLEIKK